MPSAVPLDEALPTLADDLRRLDLLHVSGKPVALGEILDTLGDRGHGVAALVLAAPMLISPIPGGGLVSGSVIALLALAIGLNRPPWLPEYLRQRQLPAALLHRFVQATTKVLQRCERFVRPRLAWATTGLWHRLLGISLFFAGIAVALPLPIPGNNIPPAIAVVILALGLLEHDGWVVLVGHFVLLLVWLFIAVLAVSLWSVVT